MRKIVLARIDDRLIHGQVVTAWIRQYPVNRILIIDDQLVSNPLLQRIYKAAAPAGIVIEIGSLAEGIALLKEDGHDDEHYLVLSKGPEVMEKLVEEGLVTGRIILGGMGLKKGRKTFTRNISASDEEIDTFKRIIDMGIDIVYQLVPDDSPVSVKSLIK